MTEYIKILAGFAGIGKTTLQKKYQNVIDLESSAFKWLGTEHTTEESKGITGREKNPDFPRNYMKAIKKALTEYSYVLTSCGPEVIRELIGEGQRFIVVYPSLHCKEEYIQRYRDRGNKDEFIQTIESNYDSWIEKLSYYKHQIVLGEGETLEDYLSKHNNDFTLIRKVEFKH